MWDGNLGTIKATPHLIEITEGAMLSFQPPCRAGQTKREYEKKEIERTLKAEVIELSTSE